MLDKTRSELLNALSGTYGELLGQQKLVIIDHDQLISALFTTVITEKNICSRIETFFFLHRRFNNTSIIYRVHDKNLISKCIMIIISYIAVGHWLLLK